MGYIGGIENKGIYCRKSAKTDRIKYRIDYVNEVKNFVKVYRVHDNKRYIMTLKEFKDTMRCIKC